MPTDFREWSLERRRLIEARLDALLPPAEVTPARLHAAMRYAVLGGGKRVRPLLACAAGELADAPLERTLIVGAAIEFIHAYSLVHDDLPCMDDDVLRRGRPTCHVEFDEATALLVGDALQSFAFQTLAEHRVCDDPARQVEMIALLAAAAGSRGMAGGQAIDLAAVGCRLDVAELELMHRHKTGAVTRAALRLGAGCGRALVPEERARIDEYAHAVGLAFQVVDDVLDADSTTATLGKTAGKDARMDKPTYATTMGIEAARRFAHELCDRALAALEPFGDKGLRLRQLAQYIVARKS